MIELISSPPALAFSGDPIQVRFALTDVYDVAGQYAVNEFFVPNPSPVDSVITLSYGANNIPMTAKEDPDDSGNEFSGGGSLPIFPNPFLNEFKQNYILSRDFVITQTGGTLIFTAKKKGRSFNMIDHNTVSGISPRMKPNLTVRFLLYCEKADYSGFEEIYNGPLTVHITGDSGTADVFVNDKLHDYISDEIFKNFPDVPDQDPLLCKKTCRRYYFEFAESYGEPVLIRKRTQSPMYTILHGGLSYLGRTKMLLSELLALESGLSRFLKQGGNINTTRSNQRQFLYYFNQANAFDALIRCRLRFTDGTKEFTTLESLNFAAKRKYGFNVSFDQVFNPDDHPGKTLLAYEIWITDQQDVRKSETQTYLVDYRYLQYMRYFHNWSSWGTMDSRCFYGKGKTGFDLSQSESEKSLQPTSARQGQRQVYDVSLRSKSEISTGFIKTRDLLIYNRDFFLSPLKYRDLAGEFLPLKVTSKSIDELEDGNPLLFQKFEYEYLFDDHAFTEGDVQEPGLTFDDIDKGFGDTLLTDIEQRFLLTTNDEFIAI